MSPSNAPTCSRDNIALTPIQTIFTFDQTMKMLHLAIRLAKRCFKEMTERLPIFIREILAQSHILGASVASWDRTQFMEAATLIRNKRRIILTGMGASFVAL
jgi:DNA-binding MurR/RpiR family transcriptional regulator